MSRIQKAYVARFRERLRERGDKDPGQQARRMEQAAQTLSSTAGISLTEALARVEQRLISPEPLASSDLGSPPNPRRFICDSGLGGLARWLRGAGYEADWQGHISDEQLILAARRDSATVLTTDSILIERKVFRDRTMPYLWLPPAFGTREQLATVFREFGLQVREPRCMSCGGELRPEPKEALKERIPPRTYLWLDEYFVCSRCDKLFWKGTHWERIQAQLELMFTAQAKLE